MSKKEEPENGPHNVEEQTDNAEDVKEYDKELIEKIKVKAKLILCLGQ